MQGNSPIQGSSAPSAFQQTAGLNNETEALVVKQGGKEQKLEVGRQKGKHGNRLVRKLAGMFKPKIRQQKTAAIAQASAGKFAECRNNGKIAVVQANPMLKPAEPMPDFFKMPFNELEALARNTEAPQSVQHQALETLGVFDGELFYPEDSTPSASRIREQVTNDYQERGFSDEQIQHLLKGYSKSIDINLIPEQAVKTEQAASPVAKETSTSTTEKGSSEPAVPDSTKGSGDVQRAKHQQLQQLTKLATVLASSDNLGGLSELLNSTDKYDRIDAINQQLQTQFGEDSPASKLSSDRLVELKPQELIKQAKSEGLYDTSDIQQFAADTLAQEPAFRNAASAILQNIDDIVDPVPELPARTDAMLELEEVASAPTPQSEESRTEEAPSLAPEQANVEDTPPPLPPRNTKPTGNTSQASTLQQLATNALALASSGDLAGLDELLQSSSEYKEIQFVKNQLRDQLGKDNPGYKSSISRLIALKPQDLIKQAHAAGHTEPSEVKQFAAEAIAKEKGYSKISSSILQSVNTQVDAAQSPPLTTAGERISNTSRPTAESIQEKLYAGGFDSVEELIGQIYTMNNLSELQALDEWARESYDDLGAISQPLQAIQEEITRLSPTNRPPLPPREEISVRQ